MADEERTIVENALPGRKSLLCLVGGSLCTI